MVAILIIVGAIIIAALIANSNKSYRRNSGFGRNESTENHNHQVLHHGIGYDAGNNDNTLNSDGFITGIGTEHVNSDNSFISGDCRESDSTDQNSVDNGSSGSGDSGSDGGGCGG